MRGMEGVSRSAASKQLLEAGACDWDMQILPFAGYPRHTEWLVYVMDGNSKEDGRVAGAGEERCKVTSGH